MAPRRSCVCESLRRLPKSHSSPHHVFTCSPVRVFTVSGLVSIAIKLVQFHRWNDELKHLKSFVIVFLCLVAELFVENILVW